MPNIDVVFNDATGAVLETKQTDAGGKATSTLAVASASILFADGLNRHIITWTSVAAGDTLVAFDNNTQTNVGTLVATQASVLAGASGYQAYAGTCGAFFTTSPFSISMQPSCLRAKEAVLASATDVNGNLLDYAFAKAQAAPPADAGAAAVALGAWAVPSAIGLTTQGVPDGAFANTSLVELANELPFENQTGVAATAPSTTTFEVATAFADAYQFGMQVRSPTLQGAIHSVGARVAPVASTTLAYASTLPAIDTVTPNTTNIGRPQADWTTLGNVSLATAKGGVVTFAWSDSADNAGTWALVVPPGSKGVVAPAMPTTLSVYLPHAAAGETSASNFEPPSVVFADSDLITDYAAFRAAVGVAFPLDDSSNSAPRVLLPATGKYELTGHQEIPD